MALASLTTDKDAYQQGDTVVVDIRLNNSGKVQDVVVRALIKRYGPDDVRPAADIALPIVVPSHGDHGAVGLKVHRVLSW